MDKRIDQINKALERIAETSFRKERIEKHFSRNETVLQGMRMDLLALEKSIIKEERDVIKLEQLTVSSLFLKILGSIEKQLEIERQEYLMEVLKYNELLDSIQLMEYEQSALKNALEQIDNENQEFEKLKKEKESILKEIDKPFAIRIRLKDQTIEKLMNKITKMDRAIENGEKAMAVLSKIKYQLSKVKEWGTWQYYGAGNYSAYAKKSFIDKARKNAIQANLFLGNYENDLGELFKDLQLPRNLQLDKFELFLNVFYDNLITDWIVQKHIKNALQNIQMNIDKVIRLQATIQMSLKQAREEIEKLKIERSMLIIEA